MTAAGAGAGAGVVAGAGVDAGVDTGVVAGLEVSSVTGLGVGAGAVSVPVPASARLADGWGAVTLSAVPPVSVGCTVTLDVLLLEGVLAAATT